MWAWLALLTALLTSFNPILYKRILANAESAEAVWGVTLLSLPLLAATSLVWVIPFPQVDKWFFAGVFGSAILNIFAQLTSTQAFNFARTRFETTIACIYVDDAGGTHNHGAMKLRIVDTRV